jgi:hypothetical protein
MNTSISKHVICCITIFHLLLTGPAIGEEMYFQEWVPGTTYYFDEFDPKRKQWLPRESRNLEEVFKNYQYVEIVLDSDGSTITVTQYVQGRNKQVTRYRILPERGLQKLD